MSDFKKLRTLSQYLFLGFILVFSSAGINPARAYTSTNKLVIDLWYTPSHYGSTEASVATVLAEQLQSTGLITVNLHTQEWSSYIDNFVNFRMPIFLLGWYPDYVDPDDYMYTFGTTAGTNSIGTNYMNATMNQTAINARIASDQPTRTTLYHQMQTQMSLDNPEIPLWQGISEAFTKTTVKGVILDASTIFRYYKLFSTLSNNTLTIGTTDKLFSLDPAKADDYYSVNVLQNIGDGLLSYVPNSTDLQLAMATKYTVSTTGLNYTVSIRSGLKFADGHPINATVFQTSITRARDLNGDPAYLLQGLVQSVDVLNNTAFRVNLAYPFSVFPSLMAAWVTYPVDSRTQNSTFNDNYAGSGPYKIQSYTPGVELDLTANPNYYGTAPYVTNVHIKFLSDSAALTTAIEAGTIDVAYRTFNPSDSQSLQGMITLKHWTGPGAVIRYLVINNNPTVAQPGQSAHPNALSNSMIRQAIAYAINRTQITSQVFQGTTQNLYTMVPIGMWSSIPAWMTRYGADQNLAQSIAILSSITSAAVAPPIFLIILAPLLLGTVFIMRRKVWRT